jgi:hypothetical protein
MMAYNCRSCRFSATTAGQDPTSVDGYCRYDPPVMRFLDGDRINSSFPPVNLDLFKCGKWKSRSFWRRLFGRAS